MREFALQNPGTTLLIVWVLAWAFTRPFHYAWRAYNRRLRAANIAKWGYPTNPLMDADGDIIHPPAQDGHEGHKL